jgi:hypothetical protein
MRKAKIFWSYVPEISNDPYQEPRVTNNDFKKCEKILEINSAKIRHAVQSRMDMKW